MVMKHTGFCYSIRPRYTDSCLNDLWVRSTHGHVILKALVIVIAISTIYVRKVHRNPFRVDARYSDCHIDELFAQNVGGIRYRQDLC